MKGKDTQIKEEEVAKDKPLKEKETGESATSSKGSSPDMDEYEVITKGKCALLSTIYIYMWPHT